MIDEFIKINTLSVSKVLADFVSKELLSNTKLSADNFWNGFEKTVNELAPRNKELLEIRETLQKEIDLWHKKNRSKEFNLEEYQNFLKKIGYLKEQGSD